MNCPYCDEGIHPNAKFCPKCGLPLKDDATVIGGYLPADGRPAPWMIAAGVAAILVVALSIGWAQNRSHAERETFPQAAPAAYTAPAVRSSVPLGIPAIAPAAPWYGQQSSPALNAGFRARYAYEAPRRRMMLFDEVLPPPIPLAQIAALRPRELQYASVPRPAIPAVPSYPGQAGLAAPPTNSLYPVTPFWPPAGSFTYPPVPTIPPPGFGAPADNLNPFTAPTTGYTPPPTAQPTPPAAADSRTE